MIYDFSFEFYDHLNNNYQSNLIKSNYLNPRECGNTAIRTGLNKTIYECAGQEADQIG